MSYKKKDLNEYLNLELQLIPLNPWNKMKLGKERGKTPRDSDWTSKLYNNNGETYNSWVEKGYNLGYRIGADELVLDLDPRNYGGKDIGGLLCKLFGYLDFEDMTWELPTVLTGGGGYHIYFKLPKDCDYKRLRVMLDGYPGVEFKHKGFQVVAAGSRHPNGNYYTWYNRAKITTIPNNVLEMITRPPVENGKDYASGKGVLNGTQLQSMILDKLEVTQYSQNDQWFPVMCACHHVTDGTGIEEFVEWSIGDPDYASDENTIRNRWESLGDEKDNNITIATLIRQLELTGKDSSELRGLLAFSQHVDFDSDDNQDTEEQELLIEAKRVADDIDINDMYCTGEDGDAGVDGAAISAARDLHMDSTDDEIMGCLRLIKAANMIEKSKAINLITSKKIMKQGDINKILKEMEVKMADDLALLLSDKTLEKTFNRARHLTCPPSGIVWTFNKTHWIQVSDEFLAKLVQKVLHVLKPKMKIETDELTLITKAVKLSRIAVATVTDRVNGDGNSLPPSVVNCKNGELWINRDGSHTLKPHSYSSYLKHCLDVEYDPSAECPLFMETIQGIFSRFLDTDDIVRHIGEIMGYCIQPYKNIPAWFLFRGPGGDGKSTLIKIMGGILGDSQVMSSVKLLAMASGGGDNHAATSLVSALNIIIEELPVNYLLKDEAMKMLSENTKMEVNPKGKDRYQFMYSGTLIMCSNGYPLTRDLSHGMMRRANIIPFNQQFDKTGRADIDRVHKILTNKEEMSGLLNFMLKGLQRLRDRGRFLPPETCVEAKDEWLSQANSVALFVKECVEVTGSLDDCMGEFSTVYSVTYNIWCQEADIDERYRKRKSHFKKDLENLGMIIKTGGGNVLKVYGGRLIGGEIEDFGSI